MADKKSFVMYADYEENFDLLSDEELGRLIRAIFGYVNDGLIPSLSPSTQMAFSFIRKNLDRDKAKYEETCRRRAEAGRRSGEARRAKADNDEQDETKGTNVHFVQQNGTKRTDTVTVTGTGTGTGTGTVFYRGNSDELPGEKKQTRFTPPTVEEVRAYCRERGNSVNPETFVDFYTGKGWMVGKNKMKDWKAAVRTWEKNRDGHTQAQKINRDDYDNGDQVPW